jgi:hypothetical protein
MSIIFLMFLAFALTNQRFRTGFIRFILSPAYTWEQRSYELKLWREGKRGVVKDTPPTVSDDPEVKVIPHPEAAKLLSQEKHGLWPKFIFGRVIDIEHGVAKIMRSEQADGEVYLPAPNSVSKGDFVAYILKGPRKEPEFYQIMGLGHIQEAENTIDSQKKRIAELESALCETCKDPVCEDSQLGYWILKAQGYEKVLREIAEGTNKDTVCFAAKKALGGDKK